MVSKTTLVLLLAIVIMATVKGKAVGKSERRSSCVRNFCSVGENPCCGQNKICHCFGDRAKCRVGLCRDIKPRYEYYW
ncbi:hypothetical protein SNE40_016740 [Patella caerulea]|uniref:Uncharacterized protein n=1 Tax=Patella caerulea TaxID=87958 RepID=A0AAN8JDU5_PATCE